MRENGIQLLFRHQTMSDACTSRSLGRTRVELSVDMLAYVIGLTGWCLTVHHSQPVQNQHLAGIDPP
jgi:hypothetical protein